MKIIVVGSGYVGLITAACLAEVGNVVICYDKDLEKIDCLSSGNLPIYEPGLAELVHRNIADRRLRFVSKLQIGLEGADVVFITVGTPPLGDGSADTSGVIEVAGLIGKLMTEPVVIVSKSTVPVGTAGKVRSEVQKELNMRSLIMDFSIVSNPEFLKEGSAVNDFMKPDRILVGADSENGLIAMRELYKPFQRNRPCLMELDIKSVELSKYAANAMLANRISFMNEISQLSEYVGADIESIRIAIGSDPRIGHDFLYAGCGYGGSCFPKDTRALSFMGKENGYEMPLVDAVTRVNETQKLWLLRKVLQRFGDKVSNLDFAIWGLTFKPNTDDMRESPSLPLITGLLDHGARVRAFDPLGNSRAKEVLFNHNAFVTYDDMYTLLDGCAALMLVTEWKQFRSPDFREVKRRLRYPILFDGRNQWDPARMKKLGFEYTGVGRS